MISGRKTEEKTKNFFTYTVRCHSTEGILWG